MPPLAKRARLVAPASQPEPPWPLLCPPCPSAPLTLGPRHRHCPRLCAVPYGSKSSRRGGGARFGGRDYRQDRGGGGGGCESLCSPLFSSPSFQRLPSPPRLPSPRRPPFSFFPPPSLPRLLSACLLPLLRSFACCSSAAVWQLPAAAAPSLACPGLPSSALHSSSPWPPPGSHLPAATWPWARLCPRPLNLSSLFRSAPLLSPFAPWCAVGLARRRRRWWRLRRWRVRWRWLWRRRWLRRWRL